MWKPASQRQRLEHHAALLAFEDVEPNDSDNIDNDSYMNGVSDEGTTRGAAGRISTANGLVLFCTAVCDALARLEKARADKATADAAAAAERAAQLASEMDVTQVLHRLGFIADINKPLTADAMKAFIRAQRQLDGVQRINKTGSRDVLLANTRRVLQESPGVVFLHASEENHTCRQCAKPYDANERDANGDGLKWVGCENDGCGAWFCPTCAPDEGCAIASAHVVVVDRNAAAAAATVSIVVVVDVTKTIVVCIVNNNSNNNNNIDSKQNTIDHTIVDKHYIDEHCIDNDIRFTKLVNK
jgi:hypothetical protein